MELFTFDDAYVRRLREKDPETEAHFDRYFRKLLRSKFQRQLPTNDALDDVIQETFRRVLSALDNVRDGRRFGAYVLGVAKYCRLERFRESSRSVPLDETNHDISNGVDLYEELERSEKCDFVRRVLEEIEPRRDAEILEAIFFEEAGTEELCRRFKVGPDYIRVLLHRAKKNFRRRFPP